MRRNRCRYLSLIDEWCVMKFQIISTGSKGNAYILKHRNRQLLLDAGVPFEAIKQALGFRLNGLQAALITHEHQDHCRSMSDLLMSGIDVYSSAGTAAQILGNGLPYCWHRVEALKQFVVGHDWSLLPFDVRHDAAEPLGFLIWHQEAGNKILYLTDSGYVRYRFKGVTQLVIECNHVGKIVLDRYQRGEIVPEMYLRLRQSHMSLERVLRYLSKLDLSRCRKIVLVHLSDENSDECRMVQAISDQTGIETVAGKDSMRIDFDLCPF